MSDTPQQARLRAACRTILAHGIKPTPTMLEKVEPSFVTRKGTNITLSHGRLSKVRQEEFERAGWTLKIGTGGRGHHTGRWTPPPNCPYCGEKWKGGRPHDCN